MRRILGASLVQAYPADQDVEGTMVGGSLIVYHARPAEGPAAELARTHNRTVVALSRHGAFLPARLAKPCPLPDVLAAIDAAATEITDLLTRYGRHAEVVARPQPCALEETSGARYLRALAARRAASEARRDAAIRLTEGVARRMDGVVVPQTTDRSPCALVPRTSARAAVNAMRDEAPAGVDVSGPWPPYAAGLSDLIAEAR
jgi:hypothetical protein